MAQSVCCTRREPISVQTAAVASPRRGRRVAMRRATVVVATAVIVVVIISSGGSRENNPARLFRPFRSFGIETRKLFR